MKASIIIPAFNASSTLDIVLQALTRQDFSDFEIIVVDDASTDNTSQIAESFTGALTLRLFQPEENLGRARARNFGVEKSGGEIVLLLDSDIETVPGYVSAHLALHDRESRAVGVGVLRYPPPLAKRALACYYASRGGARLKPGQPLPGKYFVSCLASFRRALFDEIGGFHPGFCLYGGEDLELGLRFEKSGARLAYLPGAIGYHHHLRTLKEVVSTLERYGRDGIPLVLDSHPEFAREMALDDVMPGSSGKANIISSTLHRLLTSSVFVAPLLEIASRLEAHRLPSGLLTYLHYCAYRRGFIDHLRSADQKASPEINA